MVFCEAVVFLVDGRSIFGLMLFAFFFKLADHHCSRSVDSELLELWDPIEVLIEEPVTDRCLALRCLRAPKVSTSCSRMSSAANMFNQCREIRWGAAGLCRLGGLGERWERMMDMKLSLTLIEGDGPDRRISSRHQPSTWADGVATLK